MAMKTTNREKAKRLRVFIAPHTIRFAGAVHVKEPERGAPRVDTMAYYAISYYVIERLRLRGRRMNQPAKRSLILALLLALFMGCHSNAEGKAANNSVGAPRETMMDTVDWLARHLNYPSLLS